MSPRAIARLRKSRERAGKVRLNILKPRKTIHAQISAVHDIRDVGTPALLK